MRKGIAILTEIILSVGIIAAGAIFFLVGYDFLGHETQTAYKYTELQFLLDIGNRIDTSSSQLGRTTVEYRVPFDVYSLKGENNILTLQTADNPSPSHTLLEFNLKDFNISDQDYICLYFKNKTAVVEPGECPNLNVSDDFCANLRCVDGICTSDYGENCLSPDCNCSGGICQPHYKTECLDSKGCVKEECVGVLNYSNTCKYSWECGTFEDDQMNCKPSKNNISNKGCCPPDEVWNGTQCTIGCVGDPCVTGEECGTGEQCGTSDDLVCNPTDINFTDFNKGCCPENLRWNGSTCVEALTICNGPLPAAFDWRDRLGKNWLPPIRDQGHCGSCWAFSAIGTIEGEYQVESYKPDSGINLAEQELVSSCCSSCGSCSGGWPHKAFSYVKSSNVVDETCFPYRASNMGCNKCGDAKNKDWTVSSFIRVSGTQNIKRALACRGPLSVASMNWGHAIVLVAYDDDSDICRAHYGKDGCWVIRNSWGVRSGVLHGGVWHDKGYGYIPYSGHSKSDIVNYVYYVTDVREA